MQSERPSSYLNFEKSLMSHISSEINSDRDLGEVDKLGIANLAST